MNGNNGLPSLHAPAGRIALAKVDRPASFPAALIRSCRSRQSVSTVNGALQGFLELIGDIRFFKKYKGS
jgi:hypothetical protein